MKRTCGLLAVAVVTLAAAPAAARDAKYRAARTESGVPDLQGGWNFTVPLQWPPAFADNKGFTQEECAQRRASVQNALAAIGRFAPVEAVGLDWMDSTPPVEDFPTSLIRYPANGRLPARLSSVRRMPGALVVETTNESNYSLPNPLPAARKGEPGKNAR